MHDKYIQFHVKFANYLFNVDFIDLYVYGNAVAENTRIQIL